MLVILIATGCKKLVQVNEPDDSLSTNAVFSNDSLAQAAVTGLYINIMRNTKFLLNGGMSLFSGLSADELTRTSPLNSEDQFSSNAILSSNQLVNVNLWKAAYSYIYQCNICLEGLRKSSTVSVAVKKQLTGEVQFVRALCYFYLVNLYGDVPLVLGTNADVNALMARTPVKDVYKEMETDLVAASDALAVDDRLKTTPTRYAAEALLARVYLHQQNWSKAEQLASAVINCGLFMLESDLTKVFKTVSKETIFQWAPVADKINAAEGFIFIPSINGARPTYKLTDSLLAAFEAGDQRKKYWVKTTTGSPVYNYPFKYQIYQSTTPPEEYNVVLRLGEQYLIRAEALARQNRVGEAVNDINIIRNRAQLPGISPLSSEDFFKALEQERRIELFAEWGHRWFDLKRTNRVSVFKGNNWNSNNQLYPIPFSELQADPNLEQNDGYE